MGPSLFLHNEVAIFSASHLLYILQEVQTVGNHVHDKRRNADVWHRTKDFPFLLFCYGQFNLVYLTGK